MGGEKREKNCQAEVSMCMKKVNSCFFYKVVLTRPQITIRNRALSEICVLLV